MRKSGILFTCARCKREEFVDVKKVKTNTDWRPIVLNPDESGDVVDICSSCSALFDEMYKIFISSFDKGILLYTDDGRPVIFDTTLLTGVKKEEKEPPKEESSNVEIEKAIEEVRKSSFHIKKFNLPDLPSQYPQSWYSPMLEKKVFESTDAIVNIWKEDEEKEDG